jgi:DNA-binding response OmpR family regulator
VVDDEVDIGDLVTTILSSNGHTVDVTVGYKGALRKLEGNSYDAILMDIRMPGMSGTELYELMVKTNPSLANKFIFITGDTSDANTRAFLEQNKLAYITKPFDREILLQKVNALL